MEPRTVDAHLRRPVARGDHRQDDVRGTLGVVVDGLLRHFQFFRRAELCSRVRIAIELREVAAGDVHADPVAAQEGDRRADEIDLESIHLAWLQRGWFGEAFPYRARIMPSAML